MRTCLCHKATLLLSSRDIDMHQLVLLLDR